MYCSNCGAHCGEEDRYCCLCGTPIAAPKVKKGSRWFPALLVVLISVAGLLLFFATAGKDTPIRAAGSSPWFYVKNGVLYFEEHRYTGGSELTVPSEIAGQTVLALSDDCFAGCTELTTVILPDTLVTIGNGAFSGCTSLRGIYIPKSVNMIGADAFMNCAGLEAICIHSRIKLIQENAFDNCDRLGYIIFLGSYDRWNTLYDEFINPYTGVFCDDGSFYQGGEPYQ